MRGSSYSLLDAANSNTAQGFLQHGWRRSKKTARSWRVSGGLSALPDEPAQTTDTPENKTKPINISNEKTGFDEKYNAMAYKTAGRWPEIGALTPPDGWRRVLLGGSA
jgi:hypothetical protein